MLRNQIWLIDLDPTIGAEIQKIRPVVIVNDNRAGRLPLKVIVPITDWKDAYMPVRWMVRLEPDTQNGLGKISAADTFQIRSASHDRFLRYIGILSDADMQKIAKALTIVLRLKP